MAGFLLNFSSATVELETKAEHMFGSYLGFAVLKNNLFLLEGLEFTPPSSARTKGDIYVPGTYTKIFFFIFRSMTYRRLLFFILGRSVSG